MEKKEQRVSHKYGERKRKQIFNRALDGLKSILPAFDELRLGTEAIL